MFNNTNTLQTYAFFISGMYTLYTLFAGRAHSLTYLSILCWRWPFRFLIGSIAGQANAHQAQVSFCIFSNYALKHFLLLCIHL